MKYFHWGVLFVILFLLSSLKLSATHIRAGEIRVERISTQSLTYKISIIGYTDTRSQVEFGGGSLEFGDGGSVIIDLENDFSIKEILDDEIAIKTYTITHTYSTSGNYTIRYFEQNRNAGVLNMFNSVDTPFYVETNITTDTLTINNSPQLLVPPIDRATTGIRFVHNPGAFDIDGDSLAYKIVTPKQDFNTNVEDYTLPNHQKHYEGLDYNNANESQTGTPSYTINSITGDLIWDSPGAEGEYSIVFIIEEWRKINGQWLKLGYVTRDMQIIVEETDNRPPKIMIPNDTCIVVGNLLEGKITAIDPNNDSLILEAFGGVFGFVNSPATFMQDPSIEMPILVASDFSWQVNCNHIRKRPYTIQFKVRDKPSITNTVHQPSLSDLKIWNVTVLAPKPQGLTATVQTDNSIHLNWNDYMCENAAQMYIYRRIDSYNYSSNYCESGIRDNSGYTLIDSVTIGTMSYLDNKNQGLDSGTNYCYRLVAVFPLPTGGQSIVSEEACAFLEPEAATSAVLGDDATICLGDNTNISVTITSGKSPFIIEIDNGIGVLKNYNKGDLITVSPNTTTTYKLISVIDSNGFSTQNLSGSATIMVGICTGVEDELLETFSLYPNPSNGHVTIDGLVNKNEIVSVAVYDKLGKVVYQTQAVGKKLGQGIDLGNLTKGIYFVKLKSEKVEYQLQKVVIQ